ncbi:arsenate reductase family protein [Flavobacterium sp. LB2P84]|jgi:arsenate reductase|uniref:Arsenate reductase family protein n=1 Tax=Flavobacterium yafengii TaxID=3041253 RepID=A0AAW6TMV6_9FLAO|nr:arsenate reductase family protein [Flavobacterium yafengii]MDI5949809.1 arsenate reductase family protein [Flavobacterium yafengii]MDI6033783.1 arsenate reductase family protein [Flavobacterium yafengii]
MIQIYHNSRCGKSRNCLAFIENSKKEFEVINYLINPPTYEELSAIIEKLNRKPIELVRQKEKIWIENFKDQKMNDKQIIQALISNPILIERPIVINGNSAIIGRDLEKVASFIL